MTYQRTLRDLSQRWPLRTSKKSRGSAAIPEEVWSKLIPHTGLENGLGVAVAVIAKVGANENPSRNKPSRILLGLRFLLFSLLLLFATRHRALRLYHLADLVHVRLRRGSSKTADLPYPTTGVLSLKFAGSSSKDYVTSHYPAVRPARSLAVRTDTWGYSDSPSAVGLTTLP